MVLDKLKNRLRVSGIRYLAEETGVAVAEFALVFPVMFLMLLGIWDVGHLLWAGQKVITTSQVVADLVGREQVLDQEELDQIMQAAELTMQPFNTSSLYVEILSVGFDSEGDITEEEDLKWEASTDNAPVGADLYDTAEDLSIPYDGLILVRVNYDYSSQLGGRIFDTVNMKEVAFARGRRSSVVVSDF